MNRIIIQKTSVEANQIVCEASAEGAVAKAFRATPFEFRYRSSLPLTGVPESVAVIPLLASLLPVSWVYDATIEVDTCDRSFFESIPNFKQGYVDMYPMLDFRGDMKVGALVDNAVDGDGSLCCFSSGVDAFDTLFRHAAEKPMLLTIRGSDVRLGDAEGWEVAQRQMRDAAGLVGSESVAIECDFRWIFNYTELNAAAVRGSDNWWHGLQHGIAITSLAAPIAWLRGMRSVYIASSFTRESEGSVTCASDPSIDNHVRFCGARVIHDGYESGRLDKLRAIAEWCEGHDRRVYLRVCLNPRGGVTCSHCEKCYRTILGIYAIGRDPREYGFQYDSLEALFEEMHENGHLLIDNFHTRYMPIIRELHKNHTLETVSPALRWLWDMDLSRSGELFKWINRKNVEDASTIRRLEQQVRSQNRAIGRLRTKVSRLKRSKS